MCDSFQSELLTETRIDSFSDEEISEIYAKYHRTVNMSYSELLKWKDNPCSLKASLSRAAINRNLKLLSTPRDKWTSATATSANRTISFVSRMKGAGSGENVSKECPYSKQVISLRNWAFKP